MSATFDYGKTRATADRLITKFGQTIALRRAAATGPAYDPTLTMTDYATKGAKVEFTLRQMQSGAVLATDERWLIAAGPLAAVGITAMQPPDMVIVGGVPRQVIKADPVAPAGVVVVFDCQCRK